MLRVLVARHGQSEWNALGRWQGQADPPLSDLGRTQAAAAAGTVGAVDAIVASDLDRARTTAMIISEAIGVGPVVIEPSFRERDAGEFQGLTREEINERFPGAIEAERWPPGWEPEEQLQARALVGLAAVAEHVPDGDVLVIAHGGVIYAIERMLGAPTERIGNLAGRWLRTNGADPSRADGRALGERLSLLPEDTPESIPDIL